MFALWRERGGRLSWFSVGVLAALLHLVWFSPLLLSGGIQNQDVAGIAYNARILLEGKLPYLDTVEMKSPGPFFLVSPAIAIAGLRGLWCLAVVWATATSLTTGLLTAACWGPRHARSAVLIHAAGAHAVGLGDANYGFWMMLPFTLTQAAVIVLSSAPRRARHWLLVGAAGGAALAFKHNAVTLALSIATGIALVPSTRVVIDRLLPVLWTALGAVLVAACFIAPYLFSGRAAELVALAGSQLRYSADYLSQSQTASTGIVGRLAAELVCILSYAPAVFAFACLGLVRLRSDPIARRAWLHTAAIALTALGALSLTLRFYHHDLVMIWPAAVLVALTPEGLIDRLLNRLVTPWSTAAGASAVGLLVSASNLHEALAIRRYLLERDGTVAELCRHYGPKLAPDDAILAWGWNVWSAYEHCRRFAPGPHYKELGVLTTINTNTCSQPYGTPVQLKRGPDLAAFERELWSKPPAIVFVGTYYAEMRSRNPLDDFEAGQRLLRTGYFQVRFPGGYVVWLRGKRKPSRAEHKPQSNPGHRESE